VEGSGVGSDDEGPREGALLGLSVDGCCVGMEVEGASVGSFVGSPVGLIVVVLGSSVGHCVGLTVEVVGSSVGHCVGLPVEPLGQKSEHNSVPTFGPFRIGMHPSHVSHTFSNSLPTWDQRHLKSPSPLVKMSSMSLSSSVQHSAEKSHS